jgi:hypothetical protein
VPLSLPLQIHDKDFSVTLNAFFVVRWQDTRLVMDQQKIIHNLKPGNGFVKRVLLGIIFR